MDTQPQQHQSEQKYFFWRARVLGWILVFKRVLDALTFGAFADGQTVVGFVVLTLRVALSALADYSAVKNPTVTTQQTTPAPAQAEPEPATHGSE